MRWNTANKQSKHRQPRRARRQRGAAIAEFVVVLPALLLLGLGSIQSALFHQAKTTVTYATFEAARTGATTNALKAAMLDQFGLRIAPVFGGDGSGSDAVAAIAKGKSEARNAGITRIDIINPTREAFQDFGVRNPKTGKIGISNSHLKRRNANDIRANSGVNIQDANLLKIKTTYGYQLKVPLINSLVTAALRKIDPQNAAFYDQNRIPITAVATVRMHSEAWEDGNLTVAGTQPGGAVVTGGAPGEDNAPTEDNNDDATDGQGSNTDPLLSSGNTCDSTTTSCIASGGNSLTNNPATQGNPNSCPKPGEDTASNQTANVTGLPATGTGNPIHVVSGNKYQLETDLPGLLGLVWQRHYNSQSDYRGELGSGWRHSYDVEARPTAKGFRVVQADGRHILFAAAADERFESTLRSDGWLTLAANSSYGNEQRVTWHWRNGQQLKFNARGQLTDIILPSGAAVRLQYNDQRRLFLVRDAQNRELTLSYYPNGRLKTVLDTTGEALRYRYDDRSNLASVTYSDDTPRQYHYEDKHDPNNLTGITDQLGIRFATWSYDDRGRAVSSEHAAGVEKVTIDFNDDGTRLITNSLGEVSTYYTEQRKGLGIVTAIAGPGCSSCSAGDVQYEYNGSLSLTKTDYKDGKKTYREYDANNRLTAIYEQIGNHSKRLVSRFGFNGNETLPSRFSRPSINPEGYHSMLLTRNNTGQIIDIIEVGYAPDYKGDFNKMERSTRYEYKNGTLYASDGPVPGTVDRVVYSANRQKPVHPAATKPNRRNSQQITLNGRQYNLDYNAKGRLVSLSDKQNKSLAELHYDNVGQLVALAGLKGKSTAEYDAAGRMVAVTSPQGARQSWEWDTEGRLLQQATQNAKGEMTVQQRYEYNALNQLALVTHMNGETTQLEYAANSQLTSRTDATGSRTDFGYDDAGLRSGKTQFAATHKAVTERTKYDVHGNIIERTDARGNTSYWAYDDFGHLLHKSNPDRGVTMYRYDAAGQVIARVDESGVIARFKYNEQGQLIGIAPVDQQPTTTFAFKPNGAPQKMEGLNQVTEYTYAKGRVAEKRITLKDINKQYVTRYSYDESGELAKLRMPGGQTLLFESGNSDKTTVIKREGRVFDRNLFNLSLDDNGGLAEVRYSNNQTTAYRYHTNGTLASLEVMTGAETISKQLYRYTRDLQISDTDTTSSGETQTRSFQYDEQGRLIAAEQHGETVRWAFDKVGNRVQQQQNGTTDDYRYAASSNRMLARNGEQISYLSTGEIRANDRFQYEYTAGHRLSRVYAGDKLVAEYQYNADGERIAKTDHTQTPAQHGYYLYEDKKLVAELNAAGKIQRQYVYAGSRLVGMFDGQRFYAVHTNHRGAPEMVTNKYGEIVWRASYSPYGDATLQKEKITLNVRLPGQYFDHETGHHYNIYRSYDPATGRYLTSDPLGVAAGFNTYAYVKNDPLNRIDPLGLYDEYVHYYMTYFLAVTAGIPKDQAEIIARATQYVDDNPLTNPIPDKQERLALAQGYAWGNLMPAINEADETLTSLKNYHFTLDYRNGDKGDVGTSMQRPGESDNTYARRRFQNPQSAQLTRLQNAALRYNSECQLTNIGVTALDTKSQLYGEYLHAFEDTFAHRNADNESLARFNWQGIIGHLTFGESPDHTYNQVSESRPRDNGMPGNARRFYLNEEWIYNELRTLQMEQEVYKNLQRDFADEIAANGGPKTSWRELAGDGNSRIGDPVYEGITDDNGYTSRAHSASGVTGVLQEFNAYDPTTHLDGAGAGEEAKVAILNKWLEVNSGIVDKDGQPIQIPEYDNSNIAKAAEERARILGGIDLGAHLNSEPKAAE